MFTPPGRYSSFLDQDQHLGTVPLSSGLSTCLAAPNRQRSGVVPSRNSRLQTQGPHFRPSGVLCKLQPKWPARPNEGGPQREISQAHSEVGVQGIDTEASKGHSGQQMEDMGRGHHLGRGLRPGGQRLIPLLLGPDPNSPSTRPPLFLGLDPDSPTTLGPPPHPR